MMNTRHNLWIIVFIVPVYCLLAAVSIARGAGNDFIVPITRVPSVIQQSGDPVLSDSLVLTDTQTRYPLGLKLDILEDPSGELTIEDVSSPAVSGQFTASKKAVPNFGYTDSAYWVRFILDNKSRKTTEYLLEMSFPNTQYLDLYSPQAGGAGYAVRQSGALRPVSTRDVDYPNFIYDINVPLQSHQTYFIRFKSGASMTLPLTLWTKNAFIDQSGHQLMLHWLIFGGLFALLLYHLFLLIRIREATYLYFVTLLACMLIFLLDYSGYMVAFLFPGLYTAKYYIIPLYIAGFYASIILFSDAFLELKARHPKLHLVNIGLLVAWGAIVLLDPFLSYLNIARMATPLQLITIGATWVIGVLAWRKGARSFGFFMVAWLGMAASLFLLVLVRMGIIPSTYFDENIFQFGCLLMAASWSLALADRIKVLKDETESANRDLRFSETKLTQILEGLPVGIVVYDNNQKPTYINQRTSEILGNPHINLKPDPSDETTFTKAVEQFPFRVAGTDQHYPVEKTPLYQALNGITSSTDDIELAYDGKRVPLEVWARPITDDQGTIKSAVAIFQDITQRKQSEAELIQHRDHLEQLVETRTTQLDQVNRQLQMRLDWLSEVLSHQQLIKGTSSLPAVYDELMVEIQRLFDAKLVFILRWDYKNEQPQELFSIPHTVEPADLDFIRNEFQKGTTLRQRIEIGKIASWSMDQADPLAEPFMDWSQNNEVQFLVIAPMLFGKFFMGGLGIAGPGHLEQEYPLTEDLIERMAFDLASLTQDAILLDNTLALVAADERTRLARDLHDSVTQMLFTATLLTDVLPQIWRRDPEQGFQTLDKLRRLTRGALAEMRTLLIELRPSALQNIPLSELLSQLTEAITSRSGLPFQIAIDQIPLLPNEVQEAIYRIAQEALNNVVKHAQAIRVTVSLSATQAVVDQKGKPELQVKLVVQDDGVGFLKGTEPPGHFGMAIMRERAEAIEAELTIESQPGHGTLVSLAWTGETKPENQDE
jgi:signal transduction histidine kinase